MRIKPIKLEINDDGAHQVISVIRGGGGTARLVGGVVRDLLLKRPCKDIDIATDLLPEEVLKIFSKAGYKAIPTGIKYGTITIIANKNPYEITTLRRDLDTDGRYAKVSYTKSYEEDAARRDFTINALSYDPVEEKIYDYFSGLDDLDNRQVRFIGQADHRIKEDYLRILRFFRFSAYYASNLDDNGLEACVEYAPNIQKLSAERIKTEMDRLIINPSSVDVFRIMAEKGVFRYVFDQNIIDSAKFNVSYLDKAWVIAKNINVKLIDATLYALLMIGSMPSIKQLLSLKFPRSKAKIIEGLHKFSNFMVGENTENIKIELTKKWLKEEGWQQYFVYARTIADIKIENAIDLLYGRLSNINTKPKFPLLSQSLIQLGITGERLGGVLKELEYIWIKSEFTLTGEQLINQASEICRIDRINGDCH